MTRAGTSADLDALVDLERRCFGSGAWGSGLVEQALAAGQVLVVDDAGYVVVRVVGDVADLDRIAVEPDRRGRGLGRALLAAAVTRAATAGAERMLLEVADDNASALALYSSAGFVEIHRRRGYYPGGIDAVVMERSLG